MGHRVVRGLALVLLPLLAVCVVGPFWWGRRAVERLRAITVPPSLDAEPENRASYYLAAARTVVAAPEEQGNRTKNTSKSAR